MARMTAATLSLADFLLARFAEDEAELDCGLIAHDGSRGITCRDNDAGCDFRLKRECEAKRRIVERARAVAEDEHEYSGWQDFAEGFLRELASVYVDHPHYRDEWAR